MLGGCLGRMNRNEVILVNVVCLSLESFMLISLEWILIIRGI